ncbi:unnamed protein product [Calypogeia fissa]
MLRVKGAVQHYDWGRIGEDSGVARLYAVSSGNAIDEGKPYAELWMGTHPSGPSLLFVDESSPEHGILLNEWLQKNPDALGEAVLKKWHGELPFLFKVLSVAKALSIQAHPDKNLAEKLFQTQPKVYKDANHKPEMALALTEFEALCGFMGPQELKQVLESVSELRNVLNEMDVTQLLNVKVNPSEGLSTESQAALKRAFTTVMTLDKQTVAESVRTLTARLTKEKVSRKLSAREELLLVLEKQYPDDVGVLASLFLNHIVLKPGEAVYLAANVPHAYISGECVECMATSDNVVRAGLTPKFRDTATLSSMLTYEQGMPDLLDGYEVSLFTRRYSPPFEEFEVDLITVPGGDSLDFAAISGPSIFLVSDGRGTVVFSQGGRPSVVKKGDIFFMPAGKEFHISAKAGVEVNGHVNGHANGNGHGIGNGNGSTAMPPNAIRLYRAGVNSNFL